MKKVLLSVLCLIFVLSAALGLVACKQEHTHAFTIKSVDDRYLAAPATCTEAAKYFYSCACGEKCADTFQIGNPLGHQYGEWNIEKEATETEDGLQTRMCLRCNQSESKSIPMLSHTHTFDKQVTTEQYLAAAATCTQAATYYYSCACGEKGSTTFEHGNALGHSYSTEWSHNQTEHWHAATCGHEVETDRAAHTFDDKNVCSICKFDRAEAVTSIFLNKQTLSMDIGTEETLSATILPISAADVTISWISAAPLVATVQDGTVTAVAKGSAVIIASCGNVSATCVVTVVDPYEDFNFALDGDGYTITAYSGSRKEVVIPALYNGKPVKTIGDSAFDNCSTITDVSIPDSVVTIGLQAFYGCRSLASVVIPDNVQTIGENAFSRCASLASVVIGNGITTISHYAFSQCTSLAKVTIGNNVTTIKEDAFCFCEALTEVEIPNGVTSIGEGAFRNCTSLASVTWNAENCTLAITSMVYSIFDFCDNLTSITIGNDVKSLPEYAFRGCSGLTSVTWNAENYTSAGSSKQFLFENCAKLTNLTIGNNVKSVPARVFGALKNVYYTGDIAGWCAIKGLGNAMSSSSVLHIGGTKIEGDLVIPDGVTSIGEFAFCNCRDLTTIAIPDSVMSIGNNAFYGCEKLENVKIPDNVTLIGSSAFAGCAKLESVNIPDSVTDIGSSTFEDCKSLTSVTIGAGVKSIGENVFYNCIGLTSITIPSGIASIGNYAFGNCKGLQSIVIPESVASMGYYAFACSGLTSATIGSGVASISPYAFYECTNLKSVEIPDSITSIGEYAFYGCAGLTNATIGNGVISIGDSAFYDCTNLATVTIGNNVQTILSNAFRGCTGLRNITIPESVVFIESSVFSQCSNLNSVTWNAENCTLREGGSAIFGSCYNLTTITIGNSVKSIPDNAFNGCDKVVNVIIGSEVTYIGQNAFSDCSSLTSIEIPNSVTSIGFSAFEGCDGLVSIYYAGDIVGWCALSESGFGGLMENSTSLYIGGEKVAGNIVIPEAVSTIGMSAFRNCSEITSVIIPSGVTSIGSNAFYGCNSLARVVWNAENCTFIGLNIWPIFGNCINLTDVIIGDNVKTIPEYAFSGCSGLTSLEIPNNITTIGISAFYGCRSLTSIVWNAENCTSAGSDDAPIFEGCINVTNVTIGNNVKTIAASAFYECRSIANVEWNAENCASTSSMFYNCKKLSSVVIGDNVKIIPKHAFSGCSGLTNVTIGSSVTSIEENAFYGCTGLTSIRIPSRVTSIGNEAFVGCRKLVEVINENSLSIEKQENTGWGEDLEYGGIGVYAIKIKKGGSSDIVNQNGCLFYVYGNENYLIGYVGTEKDLILPESYNGQNYGIHTYAFYNCSSLTSIKLSKGITYILWGAFTNCTGLASMEIPNNIKRISSGTFYGCSNLISVTIGSGVTDIGEEAFRGCDKLVEVINNSSLKITKGSTDYGSIAYNALNVKNGGSSDVVNQNGYLFYTYNSVNYLLGYVGNETDLILPEDYNGEQYQIYEKAFFERGDLTSVTIGSGVTAIGDYAFQHCSGLTSVTFGSGVLSSGEYSFWNCSKLKKITILNSLMVIDEGSFGDCVKLVDIHYNGTKRQWYDVSIVGGNSLYNTGNYIIHCTDGDIGKYYY